LALPVIIVSFKARCIRTIAFSLVGAHTMSCMYTNLVNIFTRMAKNSNSNNMTAHCNFWDGTE